MKLSTFVRGVAMLNGAILGSQMWLLWWLFTGHNEVSYGTVGLTTGFAISLSVLLIVFARSRMP